MKHLISAIAAVCLTLSAVAAQASTTVYTDQASFNAVTSGLTNYGFVFSGVNNLGTSYTLGPVTFRSNQLYGLNDAYGVPYVDDINGSLTITSTGDALGLYLGSYSGVQNSSYTIDGLSGTLSVPAPDSTAFIGFVSNMPINVTFTNNIELDTIRFSAASAATTVPEPASIAMLGLGLLGFAASRRKSAK